MVIISVIQSSIPDEDRNYNSHVIVDDQGIVRSVYDKTHLFVLEMPGVQLKETDYTIPGQSIHPPVETPVGKVGLAIVSFEMKLFFFEKKLYHFIVANERFMAALLELIIIGQIVLLPKFSID